VVADGTDRQRITVTKKIGPSTQNVQFNGCHADEHDGRVVHGPGGVDAGRGPSPVGGTGKVTHQSRRSPGRGGLHVSGSR